MKLTQKRLKELLHYDPLTGVFRWLSGRGGMKKNSIAGCIHKKDGYIRILINGKSYLASRLAWLYMEGYFPENDVDHKNRIESDNKWKNLRHASHLCNMRNKNKYKNNKSGITGVFWSKKQQKWTAQIRISGKAVFLGYFHLIAKAALARWRAEIKYNFPNCNTTSSAYLYIKEKEQNQIAA